MCRYEAPEAQSETKTKNSLLTGRNFEQDSGGGGQGKDRIEEENILYMQIP